MSIGKHISLEEARKQKKLDRFIKAHKTTGDKKQFDDLMNNMALKKPLKGEKIFPEGGSLYCRRIRRSRDKRPLFYMAGILR